MNGVKAMKRWGLIVGALGVAAMAVADPQEPYRIYEVAVSSQADAERLGNSPLRIMNCEIERFAPNRVAIRKGEDWMLWTLKLPYRYVGMLEIPDYGPSTGVNDGFDYRTEYGNYATLMNEWNNLVNDYPGMVTRFQIGTSIQGEPIYGYRIFREDRAELVRPPQSVVIVGATHSREWVSPATVLHIGKKLAESLVTEDSSFTDRLIDRCAVYVIPVLNPDGYKFTWTNDRMWRKNRRLVTGTTYGVDLNRNYSTNWGGSGSSGTPSSETYRGTAAFSEPETRSLRDFVNTLPNMRAFVDYHSYGQKILWPWSYTTTPCAHAAMQSNVGNAIRSAMIGAGGVPYTAGQASTTLYISSGASKDWFFQQFTIPSYTIELRDTGTFLLPTSQIAPTQNENWAGFRALIESSVPL